MMRRMGDSADQHLRNVFPNINRKMIAMDSGNCVPLYLHGSVDITDAVAATMVHWERDKKIRPPPRNLLPEKYAKVDTTPLEAIVTSENSEPVSIDIKRK